MKKSLKKQKIVKEKKGQKIVKKRKLSNKRKFSRSRDSRSSRDYKIDNDCCEQLREDLQELKKNLLEFMSGSNIPMNSFNGIYDRISNKIDQSKTGNLDIMGDIHITGEPMNQVEYPMNQIINQAENQSPVYRVRAPMSGSTIDPWDEQFN